MDLYERAQRRPLRMKTVGGSRLDHMTNPGLGVIERVVSREPRVAPTRRLIERIVGGPHVGPLGFAVGRRNHLCREDGRLGGKGHVRAISVPAFIAAQRLEAMLV